MHFSGNLSGFRRFGGDHKRPECETAHASLLVWPQGSRRDGEDSTSGVSIWAYWLLTLGNGDSWTPQGHLRLDRACVWSSRDCWWLHVSVLGLGLLPLALGLGSAHMCPLAEVLMIPWGTFPQRPKQSCWLVSRVGWWPTSKDAGCDLKHQEWARETLLYENRWGSLGKKNRDLW